MQQRLDEGPLRWKVAHKSSKKEFNPRAKLKVADELAAELKEPASRLKNAETSP